MKTVTQNSKLFFDTQRQIVFEYLQCNTATASMVEIATGVLHKNICRYKRELEKAGLLEQVEKKLCHQTGFPAWYLTTNPQYFLKRNLQLSLF